MKVTIKRITSNPAIIPAMATLFAILGTVMFILTVNITVIGISKEQIIIAFFWIFSALCWMTYSHQLYNIAENNRRYFGFIPAICNCLIIIVIILTIYFTAISSGESLESFYIRFIKMIISITVLHAIKIPSYLQEIKYQFRN